MEWDNKNLSLFTSQQKLAAFEWWASGPTEPITKHPHLTALLIRLFVQLYLWGEIPTQWYYDIICSI